MSSLSAEGSSDFFRQGQVFLELGGGASKPNSPVLKQFENNTYAQLASFAYLASTNESRRLYGAYLLSDSSEGGKSSATNGRLGFEYAVTDWLGLGASVQQTNVKITNAYPYSSLLFIRGLSNSSSTLASSEPLSAVDLLPFIKETIVMEPLTTLDFNLGFHFPGTEKLDPYLRIAFGAGSTAGGSIIKAGGSLGLRYKLGSSFYTGIEAYGNQMTIIAGANSQSGGFASAVSEAGGRILVGFSF